MILLSFDIEEFDMPLEYNGKIDFERQISISQLGTERILNLLKKYHIKATFFSTVVFAQNSKHLLERLLNEGHELASHTWFHSDFKVEHLCESREELERLFNTEVKGFRMPRMFPVDEKEVAKAGYTYNSSVNPTYLPGRYNNLHVPRTAFYKEGVLQIPASVTPNFRIPLFWLSFHNFPLSIYQQFIHQTHQKDGYINIYFHPWEFADISDKDLKMPSYVKRNSGNEMVSKFDAFLHWLTKNQYKFGRIIDYDFKVK